MKKLLYLLAAAAIMTACQKDPDFGELSTDYMVYTTYDASYTFTGSKTVYVPQAILVPSTTAGQSAEWNDQYSEQILSKFVSHFQSAGYTVVRTLSDPDVTTLHLNVTYLENTQVFVDYPYWWWDPYWWDGGYWPGWYYPYPVVYGYTIGSLIGELVVPNATALQASQTLPTVWYTYIAGEQYGSKAQSTPYIVTGVDKAFAQSPEIPQNVPQ